MNERHMADVLLKAYNEYKGSSFKTDQKESNESNMNELVDKIMQHIQMPAENAMAK